MGRYGSTGSLPACCPACWLGAAMAASTAALRDRIARQVRCFRPAAPAYGLWRGRDSRFQSRLYARIDRPGRFASGLLLFCLRALARAIAASPRLCADRRFCRFASGLLLLLTGFWRERYAASTAALRGSTGSAGSLPACALPAYGLWRAMAASTAALRGSSPGIALSAIR